MRAVNAVRRVFLVGGALVGVFALLSIGLNVVPAFADDTSGGSTSGPAADFSTWNGIADTAGVFATADTVQGSVAPTFQTLYGRLPDGLSIYSQNNMSARASVYYPGAAIVGLGPLLCLVAGIPPAPFSTVLATGFCHLPKYPLYVQADSGNPDAAVVSPAPAGGAGSPAGIGAGNADAHADLVKGVSTNGVIASYDTPQGTGSVVHVGSIESHTKQYVDAKGNLIVQAFSRLSGIDILQGLIHIDGIYTTSTSTTDGTAKAKKTQDFQIHGVTASGMPATIGANGVTINGTGQGKPLIDAANAALQSALSKSGFSVRSIGVTKNSLLNPKLCSGGEVDGLQVSGSVTLNLPPNLPQIIQQGVALGPLQINPGELANTYFMNMVLGGACTDAYAIAGSPSSDNGPPVSLSGNPLGPTSSGPAAVPAPFAPSEGLSSPGGPLSSSLIASPVRSRSSRVTTRTRRPATLAAEVLGRNVSHGLRLLYLAFTLLFLGLVLGLRPFTPARLSSR